MKCTNSSDGLQRTHGGLQSHPTFYSGEGFLSHLFHGITLEAIVESSTSCSNAVGSYKSHLLILPDTIFTKIQAHRELVGPSDTPMSPHFSWNQIPPNSPTRRTTLQCMKDVVPELIDTAYENCVQARQNVRWEIVELRVTVGYQWNSTIAEFSACADDHGFNDF